MDQMDCDVVRKDEVFGLVRSQTKYMNVVAVSFQ